MKKNILVIGGGKSSEHQVSLISAKNILQNISASLYQTYFVGITEKGDFVAGENAILDKEIDFVGLDSKAKKISLENFLREKKIDVVFPALHGAYGEDGSIQGYLETLGIAYVGCDVISSAICMDKTITKIILEKNKIKNSKYEVFLAKKEIPSFSILQKKLETDILVVKAASQGSSIGIFFCKNQQELEKAWQENRKIDNKILVEQKITGREIEIAVLGNEKPKASLAGEIILKNYDFYSYAAKYLDEKGTELVAPAKLEKNILKKIQEIAIFSYQCLGCTGMARVDFFLKGEEIYLNEINSIPGFTKISMYPRLWEVSGIGYSDLISELIKLALEKNN